MEFLTPEDVQLKTEAVPLPELGTDKGVYVRELDTGEYGQYGQMIKGDDGGVDSQKVYAADPWLLAKGIINPDDGSPLFTVAQLTPIPARLAMVVAKIRNAILGLCAAESKN